MHKLVLIRHGESTWNRENRFTGWTDVWLSDRWLEEAHQGGRILAKEGYVFDVAYTSVLKRAIKTLWIVLEEMDLLWIPVHNSWRLNERHYGALQGLNKKETAEKHGEQQVKIWRRSYDIRPPALTADDPRWNGRTPLCRSPAENPLTECLKEHGGAVPALLARNDSRDHPGGQGASSWPPRTAWARSVPGQHPKARLELNIPHGILFVYELNDDLTPSAVLSRDPEAIAKATQPWEQLKKG